MTTNRFDSGRLFLAFLLTVTCYFALFWRLEGAYLWRDEATTANWARTMARDNSLVPLVFDGETLAVQGFDAHDFNEHLTPGMQGWLQFYVAAASFKLFGVSTFTARLPFAMVGLLSVCVMWLIGRRLYGASKMALLFPFLTVTSIWFLTAVRQTRYYGLVFFFGTLVIYEFIRLLQRRDLAGRASWYLRVALWSAGVYLSNYLAFAGLYAALCLYVFLLRDRMLLLRWSAMTAILAVIFGAEFFTFHFDFASTWGSAPQPWEDPTATVWDKLRAARNMHQEELFRMLPLVFLIPGVFYILRGDLGGAKAKPIPRWIAVACVLLAFILVSAKGSISLTWVAIFIAFALSAAAFRLFRTLRGASADTEAQRSRLSYAVPLMLGAMVAFGFAVNRSEETQLLYLCAELLVAGILVFGILRLRPKNDEPFPLANGVVLLLMLIIVVTVTVTIGVGLDKGLPRYYYHVLAAGQILAGLVVAELFRHRQRFVGGVLLAGLLIWPNLAWNVNSGFAIVERQFALNRTIDVPVIEFLRQNASPGDSVVFYRNVQGMMAHFYLPELRWVGQLDSENERAIHFRDRLPASAYDDVPDADWYAVWDNYGKIPKGLDSRYQKVWEYTYSYPMPWWDSKRGAKDERTWRIYRKREAAARN